MPDDDGIKQFDEYRERMNEVILSEAPLEIKRLFALDSECFRDGALPARTKELLGLACSLALRCDDCVTYHLKRCMEEGFSDEEIWETLAVALIVGGTIVIPHLRRAVETMKHLRQTQSGT